MLTLCGFANDKQTLVFEMTSIAHAILEVILSKVHQAHCDRFHWCCVKWMHNRCIFWFLRFILWDKEYFEVSAILRLWESVTDIFKPNSEIMARLDQNQRRSLSCLRQPDNSYNCLPVPLGYSEIKCCYAYLNVCWPNSNIYNIFSVVFI